MNYPSNSIGKPGRGRLEPVAKGRSREAKLSRRVREAFISTESGSIGEHLLFDVLIPAIKATTFDTVLEATQRFFYGTTNRSSRPAPGRASYTTYSNQSRVVGGRSAAPSRRARSQHDFEEIVFETRLEASNVLDSLLNLIEKYESCTVQDLYDLCGITPEPVDATWGWTALGHATINRVRDGYVLDLPRPEPLDR